MQGCTEMRLIQGPADHGLQGPTDQRLIQGPADQRLARPSGVFSSQTCYIIVASHKVPIYDIGFGCQISN